MAELTNDIREIVRERYANAAKAAASSAYDQARALESESGCCGAESLACSPADETGVFGSSLYDEATRESVATVAVDASLGCGVPTAVAELRDGEIVLDLGSGAGADVLISARRVAPTGRAIGLDMTDEMLDLARINAAEAGVENVEFVEGYMEDMPLEDSSVDVVISNCVINLSADKPRTIAEAARVLRPGGRFAVSDVIADPDMDAATKADMAAWTGCVAGALTDRSSALASPVSLCTRVARRGPATSARTALPSVSPRTWRPTATAVLIPDELTGFEPPARAKAADCWLGADK